MILEGKGCEVVELIRELGIKGRTPKQDPLLFALAVCVRCNDRSTKKAAYCIIPEVCRIPTHLFQFVNFNQSLAGQTSGWGRGQRMAVSGWYNQPSFVNNPMKLLRLVTKYKRRHKFSHKDVLRLSHAKPKSHHIEFAIRYLTKGKENISQFDTSDFIINKAYRYILALEDAKTCDTNRLHQLIKDYELTREHLPTRCLNSKEVWQALLYTMPIKALIRNLGKLSHLRLLQNGSLEESYIINRLEDQEKLRLAKIHPLTLLTAWNAYKRGHSGPRERLRWEVNQRIVVVLEKAFEASASFLEPNGKNILVAVDGCESMLQPVNGMIEVSARSVSAAMALTISKMAANLEIVLIKDNVIPISFHPYENLETFSQKFSLNGTVGHINPSMILNWAIENKKKYDAVIFFTTSLGCIGTHLSFVMREYREVMGVPGARFVSVGLANNEYTVTDPSDLYMLSVVGLDATAATVISNFITGQL